MLTGGILHNLHFGQVADLPHQAHLVYTKWSALHLVSSNRCVHAARWTRGEWSPGLGHETHLVPERPAGVDAFASPPLGVVGGHRYAECAGGRVAVEVFVPDDDQAGGGQERVFILSML